jgi:hypothetical protein
VLSAARGGELLPYRLWSVPGGVRDLRDRADRLSAPGVAAPAVALATARVLSESADDERRKEEKAELHRVGGFDDDLDRPPAPALAVEDGELPIALGERGALAPVAGRAQRELAIGPA